MRDYDTVNESSNKIPYDKEPIIRQTNYKKAKAENTTNKSLAVIIAMLIIFNVVIGFVFIGTVKKGGGTVNNTTVNVQSSSCVDVSAVASKAKLSAVCVSAGYTSSSTESPNYGSFFNMASRGAGVIYQDNKTNGDAYIITCYHVVKKYTSQIYVLLYDCFNPIPARLVSYSSVFDTALLKISNSMDYRLSSACSVEVADSSLLIEGDGAVAVGNPLAGGFSATSGIISKPNDLVNVDGIVHRVHRIDVPINSGNSGGGLFDDKGKLIGIVNAKSGDNPSSDKYIDNIAYAIPSNVAVSLVQNIIDSGGKQPVKADFGFSLAIKNENLKFDIIEGKYIGKQTIYIKSVNAFSTAQSAGLKVGDIITGFTYNGKTVNILSLYSLDDHLFAMYKGTSVTFTVIRGDVQKTITAVVDATISADAQTWY